MKKHPLSAFRKDMTSYLPPEFNIGYFPLTLPKSEHLKSQASDLASRTLPLPSLDLSLATFPQYILLYSLAHYI